MLTLFGKFSRKLRIDNGELLKHMADKLNVTPSYLSAVETGKRNVPQDWIEKLTTIYQLKAEDIENLKASVEASQLSIKIDLQQTNIKDKNLAMAFAREFKELNDDEKSQILEIIQNRNKGGV